MLYAHSVSPTHSPAAAEEAQLLAEAQQLAGHALSQIHTRFYPVLYRYAYYRTGDTQVAEDIAGETLMRLLTALHQQATIQSLRGWLFGVAGHLVADHFRRAPSERLSEHLTAPEAPAAEAEQHLQAQAMRVALQTLTADQQAVLALRFGDEYSIEATAEVLGKKPNAIKALQFRALGALRRALGLGGDV